MLHPRMPIGLRVQQQMWDMIRAKPGALVHEPLKAATRVADATPIGTPPTGTFKCSHGISIQTFPRLMLSISASRYGDLPSRHGPS
jgi:hypothetical protein